MAPVAMPPARGRASKTVTFTPASARCQAPARPAGPAPTIATRRPVSAHGRTAGGSAAWWARVRLTSRMRSGWSRFTRVQRVWHGWSQTMPVTVGSGLSRRTTASAPSRSPRAVRCRYPGTSWPVGQVWAQGAAMQSNAASARSVLMVRSG